MAAMAGEGVGQRGSSPPHARFALISSHLLQHRRPPPPFPLPRSPSPAPPSVLSAAFARTSTTKHADENQLFIAAAVKRLFC